MKFNVTIFFIILPTFIFAQQIEIRYNFIENYPLIPNPPIKEAFLYSNDEERLFLIIDTVDVVESKRISGDESTSTIKTWKVKKYKDNRAYYVKEDSLYSKVRLKDQFFVIKEPAPKIDWKFTSETKAFLGLTCQAAETTFRGYEFKVFFTKEIPISAGPWVFNSVPGTILYAENKEKTLIIEATKLDFSSDKTIVIEKSKIDMNHLEPLTRTEFVNQYMKNLQNERKYAQSSSNNDFTHALKAKGVTIVENEEMSYDQLPPPANIEVRGFVK